MADKPSRGLVLYGDGLARFVDPTHTHLHSLASKAACGFLSLPIAPPSESEDNRIVREFAHLLDAGETYQNMDTAVTSISDRFMGMKAAIITNNPSLKSFAGKLGFSLLAFDDLNGNDNSFSESSADILTSGLLKLLGFQEGKALETSPFDLVVVHIGAGEPMNGVERGSANPCGVGYINSLAGSILHVAQPVSEIGSRLLLSLVMSYGCVTEADSTDFSIPILKDMYPHFSTIIPRQSYTMKGVTPRNDVRHHSPMLVAQWQYAVTRVDMVENFSFKDFKERGVNLVVPADRFLHEVAFKLWKAPKYGA